MCLACSTGRPARQAPEGLSRRGGCRFNYVAREGVGHRSDRGVGFGGQKGPAHPIGTDYLSAAGKVAGLARHRSQSASDPTYRTDQLG